MARSTTGVPTWLRAIVAARLAFLISGGTGSGKTTILSTLLGLVAARRANRHRRGLDRARPDHPHAVRMQARTANVEGAGVVTLRDLVRQALRMRPDRIVVGEVRGAEVVDLLAAMNTGHEGGCGTIHANSAADVPARLEALGLTAGLDRLAVHALVAAGIDVVMHLGRDGRGTRVRGRARPGPRRVGLRGHRARPRPPEHGPDADVGMVRLAALLGRG